MTNEKYLVSKTHQVISDFHHLKMSVSLSQSSLLLNPSNTYNSSPNQHKKLNNEKI